MNAYSTWNCGMIPLDQIGACLPPGSEDPRLMFRVIIFSKFKTMIGAA